QARQPWSAGYDAGRIFRRHDHPQNRNLAGRIRSFTEGRRRTEEKSHQRAHHLGDENGDGRIEVKAVSKRQKAKGKGLWLFAFVFLSVLVGAKQFVCAQNPKPKSPSNDEGTIRVETSEVLLPVTVRDAAGQFAADLKAEDFMVFEDGVPQPISS